MRKEFDFYVNFVIILLDEKEMLWYLESKVNGEGRDV